jgi:hypothetical protein
LGRFGSQLARLARLARWLFWLLVSGFLFLVARDWLLVASGWLLATNFEAEVARECCRSNRLAIDGFGR